MCLFFATTSSKSKLTGKMCVSSIFCSFGEKWIKARTQRTRGWWCFFISTKKIDQVGLYVMHVSIYIYIHVFIYRAFFGGLYLDEFSLTVILMDFQCLSPWFWGASKVSGVKGRGPGGVVSTELPWWPEVPEGAGKIQQRDHPNVIRAVTTKPWLFAVYRGCYYQF